MGPYGIRSEYCIRKITCPLENRDAPKGKRRNFLNAKNNPNPSPCEDNNLTVIVCFASRNPHSTEERPAIERVKAEEAGASQADRAHRCGDMGA